MTDGGALRLVLFRLIPLLLTVCFVGWCTSSRQASAEGAPVAVELAELFSSQGLVDGAVRGDQLSGIAKRVGPSGMNRLLYAAAPDASLPALRWMVDNGADPRNIGAIENKPLLHKLAKRPQFERLEYFLKLGLDPRQRDGGSPVRRNATHPRRPARPAGRLERRRKVGFRTLRNQLHAALPECHAALNRGVTAAGTSRRRSRCARHRPA